MTLGATVRGTRQSSMSEISSVGVPGLSVVRKTTHYVPTMVTHTTVCVISRRPSAWTIISTLVSSTMDPVPHSVRKHAMLCAAIGVLFSSYQELNALVFFFLSLCAAELPTPKTNYFQTNTIPMYEDDLFNQLGQANNEFSTPRELVFFPSLPGVPCWVLF